MLVPDYLWPAIVILLTMVIIWLLGDRFGRSSQRRYDKKEWLEGKKQVVVDFTSIWSEQQNHLTETMRGIEHQINDRMIVAIQKSKNDIDPILRELDALLNRLEDSNQQPPSRSGKGSASTGRPSTASG